jgi:ubiquitin-associated SH3 domain-containing protein
MSPQELVAAGYNVELGYKPYIPAEELQDLQEQMPPESNEAYYTRNFFVTQCVLQKTEEIGGNLLFVGHAATLDACSRQLVGKEQVRLQ